MGTETSRGPSARATSVAALVLSVAAVAVSQVALSPDEERGRQIYQTGVSSSGSRIEAQLREGEPLVPASVIPCLGCHGADGRGESEGGITPPDITWRALTNPYGADRPGGRVRPPYTERLVIRAFTLGLDSAGGKLDPIMPQFRLSYADARDLVAYLKILGNTGEPGVGPQSIKLGVLLPSSAHSTLTSLQIRSALAGYFSDLHTHGGLYGRRFDFVFLDLPEDTSQVLKAVSSFIAQEHPFALLSAATSMPAGFEAVAFQSGIPSMCAFATDPASLNRYVFYTDEGVAGEARLLASYAAGGPAGKGIHAAVFLSRDVKVRQFAVVLETALRAAGAGPLEELSQEDPAFDALQAARHCDAAGITTAFWLCPNQGPGLLLKAAAAIGWSPVFLTSASMLSQDLGTPDTGWRAPFIVSAPAIFREPSAGLAGNSFAIEKVLASADILVEAVKRAGRALTREKLIQAIESLYDFDTGRIPPVRFGPERHTGCNGSRLFALNPQTGALQPIRSSAPR